MVSWGSAQKLTNFRVLEILDLGVGGAPTVAVLDCFKQDWNRGRRQWAVLAALGRGKALGVSCPASTQEEAQAWSRKSWSRIALTCTAHSCCFSISCQGNNEKWPRGCRRLLQLQALQFWSADPVSRSCCLSQQSQALAHSRHYFKPVTCTGYICFISEHISKGFVA